MISDIRTHIYNSLIDLLTGTISRDKGVSVDADKYNCVSLWIDRDVRNIKIEAAMEIKRVLHFQNRYYARLLCIHYHEIRMYPNVNIL